jgi:hypothetical protein
VLHLVEGDNGFFCLMHDDVALEPNAIGLLVEELYRSNAGIVGPKLVDWDRPAVLQHVGLSADRVGVTLETAEAGELDQEQHDAVRDVFCVPTACLLGASTSSARSAASAHDIDFYGDDLDCAGGPTSRAPGARRPRRPPATATAPRAAA